jgi:hypothetical protein
MSNFDRREFLSGTVAGGIVPPLLPSTVIPFASP